MYPSSFKQQWARRIVRENLYRELTCHKSKKDVGTRRLNLSLLDTVWDSMSHVNLPPEPSKGQRSRPKTEKLKVCIVGSGIAGLYTAMILDSLNLPGISYDLLEAANHSGGRISTHHFSTTIHDYFDKGAMRYPRIPLMERYF